MEAKRNITESELRLRLEEATGSRTDLSACDVAYAWRERVFGREGNCALAFHPEQVCLWILDLQSGEVREIPLKNIKNIREDPSCRYVLRFRRSLRRVSLNVPYLSSATGSRLHCVQLEASGRFRLFCKQYQWEPWLARMKGKLKRAQAGGSKVHAAHPETAGRETTGVAGRSR